MTRATGLGANLSRCNCKKLKGMHGGALILKEAKMKYLNLWWVPFGFAALFVLFLYNALISWNVGLVWGGDDVLFTSAVLPFQLEKPFSLTSGYFYAAGLIVCTFFQFIAVPLTRWAWRERDVFWMLAGPVLALGLMSISIYTTMVYQSSQAELAFRKAATVTNAWGKTKVKLNRLYETTHEAVPRDAAIIKAEIESLLNKPVAQTRTRTLTLKQLTRKCARPTKTTRKLCSTYFDLKTDLAKSEAYAKRTVEIEQTEKKQTQLLAIDPMSFFTLFEDITGVKPKRQKTSRSIGYILLLEALMLLGVPFLSAMISVSLGRSEKGNNSNPLPPETVAESVPESVKEPVDESVHDLDRAIEASGGKVTRITQPSISPKERALIDYMRTIGPQPWQGTEEFMKPYRRWCKRHNRPAYGTNYVGNVIVRYGGDRRLTYIQKEGQNKSGRILWKVNAVVMPDDGIVQRKAA